MDSGVQPSSQPSRSIREVRAPNGSSSNTGRTQFPSNAGSGSVEAGSRLGPEGFVQYRGDASSGVDRRKGSQVVSQQQSSFSQSSTRLKPPPLVPVPKASARVAQITPTQAPKVTPHNKVSPKQPNVRSISEEEVLKGIRIQHQFAEKPELNWMINSIAAAVRHCRDSSRSNNDTKSSSNDWDTIKQNVVISAERYKARVLRHLGHIEARRNDILRMSQMPQTKIPSSHLREKVEEAKEELCRSKIKRKHRDEYEKLAGEINKKPSTHLSNEASQAESERIDIVAAEIANCEKRLEFRQKQAGEFMQLCKKFKEIIQRDSPEDCEVSDT